MRGFYIKPSTFHGRPHKGPMVVAIVFLALVVCFLWSLTGAIDTPPARLAFNLTAAAVMLCIPILFVWCVIKFVRWNVRFHRRMAQSWKSPDES